MPEQPFEEAEGAAGLIRVLGLEDSDGHRGDRLSLKKPAEWRLGRSEIPVDEFRRRVVTFLDSMRDIIADLPDSSGGFRLDQVTVSAEVSAKGQISLLGSGGELAGKAGLTFTFTRRGASTADSPGLSAD
jgi:hypothetical protein